MNIAKVSAVRTCRWHEFPGNPGVLGFKYLLHPLTSDQWRPFAPLLDSDDWPATRQAFAPLLASAVKEWNLLDDDGRPVDPHDETTYLNMEIAPLLHIVYAFAGIVVEADEKKSARESAESSATPAQPDPARPAADSTTTPPETGGSTPKAVRDSGASSRKKS